MKCPYCGFNDSKVIDSRPTDEGEKIRRRRECISCVKRFTTFEIVETLPIVVIKKDRSREAFDRNKLLKGLIRACANLPVSVASMEKIVDSIEAEITNSLDREISSMKIGELAMRHLKDLNEVAYVRFASVYRSFKDVNSFFDELKKLMEEQSVKSDITKQNL